MLGTSGCSKDENNRVTFMVNLFSFVGMSITAILSIVAGINNNFILCSVLLASSCFFYLGRHLQLVLKNSVLSSLIILFSLYALMIYLVYSGGVNNTGPLWIFMVAPVTFFVNGLRRGLISLSCFLSIVVIMLFYNSGALLVAQYSTDFKLRLIYSFITTSFLSAYYEYSRQKSFEHMQQLSLKYEKLSRFDPLTGLSNRRDAMSILEYEYFKIGRENKKLCIVLCDVDHFKKVNDSLGHDAGDQVLVALAKIFSDLSRKQDLVARWGGEEFLFMLPETDLKGALFFTRKVHNDLSLKSINYQGSNIPITVSMGVAEVDSLMSIESSIRVADNHLYQAKESGRDKTCYS